MCSAELRPGANYCTQCGASTAVTVISFDEETTGGGAGEADVQATSWASRLVVAGGLLSLVVLVGLFVFGGSSPGDDEVAPEPTPTAGPTADAETGTTPRETPALPEPRAGEPLIWDRELDLGEMGPVDLVEHQGQLFLFTTALEHRFGGWFGSDEAGLAAHVSANGETWVDLGEVIGPPATVVHVVASDFGLLAGGIDATGNTALWVSSDGRTWDHRILEETQEGTYPTYISNLAANDNAVLVVGSRGFGSYEEDMTTAVQEELAIAETEFSLSLGPDSVSAQGPLGLVLGSWSFDELGVSAPEPPADSGDAPPRMWRSTDTELWQPAELPGENAIELSVDDSGSFQLLSWGDQQELWRSPDGLTWTEGTVIRGADGLPTRLQGYEVSPSSQGFRYRIGTESNVATQSLAGLLPDNGSWYPGTSHADDDGLVVTYWPEGTPTEIDATQTILVVEGHRLATENGRLEIVPPDGPRFAVERWGPPENLSYRFVAETGSFEFTNPNDGSTLSVSLEDLKLLEPHNHFAVADTQMAYSPDLVTWSVGPIGVSTPKEGISVFDVALTPSHVVALAWEFDTSTQAPVGAVWSAPRPPR